MRLYLRSVLIALVLVASLTAQQVWKVNCAGGPGVHFTDLPPAVAAAAAGDTILVYGSQALAPTCPPGTAVYTAPTINKPLRIVGFYLYSPPSSLPEPTRVGIRGVITITGIPAGQQVLFSNVYMSQTPTTWPPPVPPVANGFLVTDCAGDVVIEDNNFQSGGYAGYILRIERCANVVLRGCEFYIGGSPITVIDSTVLVTTTLIFHNGPSSSYGYTQSAAGLDLQNSTATIVGSIVFGMAQLVPSSPGWAARPAVVLNQSTMKVGPWAELRGGSLGGGSTTVSYWATNPVGSTVLADPRAFFSYVSSAGLQPIATDIHATFHGWVVANQPFGVTVAGPPNGFALLVLGDLNPFPIATPFGTLAVDPYSMQSVDLVALPSPYGDKDWTFHCPSTAANGHAFVFQALTLAPNGTLSLTVPSPLTVGWEHGRIP